NQPKRRKSKNLKKIQQKKPGQKNVNTNQEPQIHSRNPRPKSLVQPNCRRPKTCILTSHSPISFLPTPASDQKNLNMKQEDQIHNYNSTDPGSDARLRTD
ncbi:hypothetical protein M758_2G172000, partial [Ceratodon purpureus]